MRLFFGIELPDGVKDELAERQRAWEEFYLGWGGRRGDYGITRPANLHVTVKFLGEVEEREMPGVIEAARGVERVGGVSLQMMELQYLPERGPVRVVAVEVGGDVEKLMRVQKSLEERCAEVGFPLEGRGYRPHVTIARGKRRGMPGRLRREEFGAAAAEGRAFRVDHLTLFESHLSREGPEYVVAGRFAV